MTVLVRRRPSFACDGSGAGLGEYALLAALIAGISAIAVTSLGVETRGTFSQIAGTTQEAGGWSGAGGGSGSGSDPGGPIGGGANSGGGTGNGSAGSGAGDSTPPPTGTPGDNFAITLGAQALPTANRLNPWSFDFSSLIAFQDPGTVGLSNLAWSGGVPGLPSWMSIDPSSGVASGTPDIEGSTTFEVIASYLDAEGRQVFTIEVGGAVIDVVQIVTGAHHTCVRTTTAAAMCWGGNAHGQLGDGTTTSRLTPVTVSGLSSGVAVISTQAQHTCAVTTSGAAMCWGRNSWGNVGDGTVTDRPAPTTVSGLNSGVVSISAGGAHTCAVTTSGAALCWGAGFNGALGDGTTSSRTVPVAVSGLDSGVASITTGGGHTCAVTTSGVARCWGNNDLGQIGDGTLTRRVTPVIVSGFSSGAASISAGNAHTCAVTTAGAARCWGWNANGRLGDGSTTDRRSPVTVSGLGSGVASISAGDAHTCAVTTAGAARCWGSNESGRLGDGTTTQRTTPVNVSGLGGGVASISAGGAHTCAVTTAGAARCWGSNANGSLGNGTTATRLTPGSVAF